MVNQLAQQWGIVAAGALAIWASLTTPTLAAKTLLLRFGPLEKSVEVEELEKFSKTGAIPPSWQGFSPLLNPQVRDLLSKHLEVDPQIAQTFLDELLTSQDGKRLIEQVKQAFPESNFDDLKGAFYLTSKGKNVSAISFLKAYPQARLVVDGSAAVQIALQLNLTSVQSQLLSPILARDLAVKGAVMPPLDPNFDPSLPGKLPVRYRSLIFNDRQRQRMIPVDLYYNRQGSTGPLVVMSHGFAADRRFFNYLAAHLASYGLTVISVEHPGSNINSLAGISPKVQPVTILPASEFVDRPQDITFVLNELERFSQDWDYLRRIFNTKKVVVIGHSLGGYTALALAGGQLDLKSLRSYCQRRLPLGRAPADWLQCAAATLPHSKLRFRDQRVVQVMAFNPILGHIFGEDGLKQVETPTLMWTGSDDGVTPSLEHQIRPFMQLSGEKYLIAAVGATHMSVTDFANFNSMVGRSTLVKEVMGTEAEPLRQAVRGVALAFIYQLTNKGEIYRPFLTPAYLQSFSNPHFSLRLTQDISPTLGVWLNAIETGNRQLAEESSESDHPLVGQIQHYIDHLYYRLRPPQYCQGQLNRILTSLLSNDPA